MKTLINKNHESDKASLCDSHHKIEVGVTENSEGIIVPLQSYMLVGFTATDTSGGGKVEEYFGKLVGLPLEGVKWAGASLADLSRKAGVEYGEGVVGGFAKGYKETIDSTGSAIKKGVKKLKFWAESPNYTPFKADWSEWVGTAYHPVNAGSHKIRFQAWCSYQGKERKIYDSEISGCTPLFNGSKCVSCCESTSIEEFIISSPGEWRIKITPIATGSCASLNYEDTATFTVPEPEGWNPVPLVASLTSFSNSVSQSLGFKVSPAVIAIAGSILVGGVAFKMIRKR